MHISSVSPSAPLFVSDFLSYRSVFLQSVSLTLSLALRLGKQRLASVEVKTVTLSQPLAALYNQTLSKDMLSYQSLSLPPLYSF